MLAGDLFRVYAPLECGEDGYPRLWHSGLIPLEDLDAGEWMREYDTRISWEPYDPDVHRGDVFKETQVGVKHIVRMQAGHRCVRCGHPFLVGTSGVMEGPCAATKAAAARAGLDQEQLDHAFADHVELFTADDLAKAPRTNWSPCDERCTHGHTRINGKISIRRRGGPGDPWSEFDSRWIGRAGDGVRHGDQVEAAWRILTVHHLNGVKADLRWWNLIAACQRCHLWLQRKVVMDQIYPFEHDDYFKPHAAGFYAFRYLGEDLTRAQTMGRLDELLALERAL